VQNSANHWIIVYQRDKQTRNTHLLQLWYYVLFNFVSKTKIFLSALKQEIKKKKIKTPKVIFCVFFHEFILRSTPATATRQEKKIGTVKYLIIHAEK
jgi:hypothetical protein